MLGFRRSGHITDVKNCCVLSVPVQTLYHLLKIARPMEYGARRYHMNSCHGNVRNEATNQLISKQTADGTSQNITHEQWSKPKEKPMVAI